ncbi:MAG: hypothetical protein GY953_47180 [bacterium]|nr:hypothetical protein [bacterium]
MRLDYTAVVFKEGKQFVAHTPELDVSSCATTQKKALTNLAEAVQLFIDEAQRMGTLTQILSEAGYTRRKTTLTPPKLVTQQSLSLSLPLVNARS